MIDDLNELPPGNYLEFTPDVNERIQAGDMYWDTEDEEWVHASRQQVGLYASQFERVARVAIDCKPKELNEALDLLLPKPAVRRIRRTRGKKC